MFLSLEKPNRDKGVSILARNLSDKENYAPHQMEVEFDSERFRADMAIALANESLGENSLEKAFSSLFHQFNWTGTTGWEYWSKDNLLMLKHALLVAEALAVPLYVHISALPALMKGMEAGLQFDYRVAKKEDAEPAKDREFAYTLEEIEQGRYYVLTNVVFTEDMPAVPQLPVF